jgi:hypothetical protein
MTVLMVCAPEAPWQPGGGGGRRRGNILQSRAGPLTIKFTNSRRHDRNYLFCATLTHSSKLLFIISRRYPEVRYQFPEATPSGCSLTPAPASTARTRADRHVSKDRAVSSLCVHIHTSPLRAQNPILTPRGLRDRTAVMRLVPPPASTPTLRGAPSPPPLRGPLPSTPPPHHLFMVEDRLRSETHCSFGSSWLLRLLRLLHLLLPWLRLPSRASSIWLRGLLLLLLRPTLPGARSRLLLLLLWRRRRLLLLP